MRNVWRVRRNGKQELRRERIRGLELGRVRVVWGEVRKREEGRKRGKRRKLCDEDNKDLCLDAGVVEAK